METKPVTHAFATLGHPGRLAVFRLLMRFAPQGVRPSEIAEALQMKPNTLSHHLSELEQAQLISGERQGRSLFYSIRLDQVSALVSYLVIDAGRNRPEITDALFNTTEADMAHRPWPNRPWPNRPWPNRPWNVLFICSGNSARSIFAEALLNDIGQGRFHAHSAGTKPGTQLNPFAIEVLARAGLDVSTLRSKHISEFETADAPKMDFVFTVCDQAAAEECAPWPGQPMTAHWGLPDPVKATGTDAEKALAFADVFATLRRRMLAFTALPFAELEKIALQQQLDSLGRE